MQGSLRRACSQCTKSPCNPNQSGGKGIKKIRFGLALILALTLALGMPLMSFAATWDASNSNDVVKAFEEDTDAEVIINMQNDITMEYGLAANEGQTYTINGNGSTISDVYLYGEGTVKINADVTGVEDDALNVSGSVNVTVNGDVTGGTNEDGFGWDAIYADDDAVVQVNGDVTGGNAEGDGYGAGDGVDASDNAKVTVDGNVTGGSGSLSDEELQYYDGYCDGGFGVEADDNAVVTVTGNVAGGDAMGTYAYAGDGVAAGEQANVTVGGDVTGGSVTADPEVEGRTSMGGDGVEVGTGATVTVEGNVTGGDTNGNGGVGGNGITLHSDGVYDQETGEYVAYEETGTVTVNGTATGGAGGENGVDGVALCYDYNGNALDVLLNTPVEELDDDDIGNMYDFLTNYLDVSSEDMDAYYALYEEQIEAAETESERLAAYGAFFQYALKSELAKADLADLAEFGYADVKVWALSDENGGMFASELGSGKAAEYSAENTAYIIKTIQPKGGTITVDKETALEGETVTVTVKVDEGYELKSVSCGGTELTANADGTYSYVVPAGGAVEFSAVVEEVPPAVTPTTGDGFNVVLVTMLAVVSVLGFGIVLSQGKKFVK